MRNRKLMILVLLVLLPACASQAPEPAPQPQRQEPPAPAAQIYGNLQQVMRGILYPASNVVFTVQDKDPAKIKGAGDPSVSPNPLTSAYGGWLAVENAGITLAEAANLLTIPGRKCSNGRDAPIKNADWVMAVQGLREAGMAVYKAAQSKNQDNILAAADTMTTACANCHDKYREKPGGEADRCM